MHVEEILIPLGAFAMTFGIIYLNVTAKSRRELAMIEAGMNPGEAKKPVNSRFRIIRTALLLLFIPSGLFIGNNVADYMGHANGNFPGILTAFMFAGLALIIYYFLERRFDSDSDSDSVSTHE